MTKLFLSLVLIFGLVGCHQGVTVAPIHQGAANAFDSTTYDALVTVQAGIEQAKVNLPPAQKPLLNKIIADYNVVKKAYLVYHTAALAGTATPQSQTDLQTQVDALKSGLASITGGKP